MRVSPKILFARAITASRISMRWWPSGRSGFPFPRRRSERTLTTNIHYVLDEECVKGMRGFFRMAAELGILPPYTVAVQELAAR